MSEKLTCTCGGEMVLDRSNPLSMLTRRIPRLICTACKQPGGMEDWGRNLFPVQKMPEPTHLFTFSPEPVEEDE